MQIRHIIPNRIDHIAMKVILLPKFDQPVTKSLAEDRVSRMMFLDVAARAACDDGIVKVLMCQDGRDKKADAAQTAEAAYMTRFFMDNVHPSQVGAHCPRKISSYVLPPRSAPRHSSCLCHPGR